MISMEEALAALCMGGTSGCCAACGFRGTSIAFLPRHWSVSDVQRLIHLCRGGQVKKMTGLEALQSLWTTDGFRLDPRGETWQLVDHDAVLIASDRATFPAAASEVGTTKPRKRQTTSTTMEEDGAVAPAAKKVKKESSTVATEASPPAAAASDGAVSAEYQQFLATEVRWPFVSAISRLPDVPRACDRARRSWRSSGRITRTRIHERRCGAWLLRGRSILRIRRTRR